MVAAPVPGCGWRPGSYELPRENLAVGHEDRRGWPRALPFPARVPPVRGRPEEPLAVVRPPEVTTPGSKEDVLRTRAPGALIVAAVAHKATRISQMSREKLAEKWRQISRAH